MDGETYDNSYYLAAMEKPSPLSEHFNQDYFLQILSGDEVKKMSLKAALATQQRVPGLGNGVLQDILWKAKLSPRRKINTLSENDLKLLFVCIKEVLEKMTQLGGRDSEKDLFGKPGGYEVIMASKNQDKPCPNCGPLIKKEAYLGGSVYYCENCQKL